MGIGQAIKNLLQRIGKDTSNSEPILTSELIRQNLYAQVAKVELLRCKRKRFSSIDEYESNIFRVKNNLQDPIITMAIMNTQRDYLRNREEGE